MTASHRFAPAAARPAASPAVAPLTLEALLRHALVAGAVLVLLLPAARGAHPLLGWLPLWLLGMPLAAWVGLRACRRDVAATVSAASARRVRPRRATAQALRRGTPVVRRRRIEAA